MKLFKTVTLEITQDRKKIPTTLMGTKATGGILNNSHVSVEGEIVRQMEWQK